MGQVVLRFKKIKTSTDVGNMANHNSRAKILDENGAFRPRPENLPKDEEWPPDWLKHPEWIKFNEGQQGRRDDSIMRAWHNRVQEAGLKRKPQVNASKAIEAVFSASAGTFKTAKEWKTYLNEGREFLEKKLGRENILQWNIHFDEKTPHLHVIFAPIIRDIDNGNKYSSANFLGGPAGLKELQTEAAKVGEPYGLLRGKASEKKHTDQSQWKSELVKKEKALDVRETAIADSEKKIADREASIKPREQAVEDREIDVENREENVRDRELAVREKEAVIEKHLTEAKLIKAAVVKLFSQAYAAIEKLPGGKSVADWIRTFDKVSLQLGLIKPETIKTVTKTHEEGRGKGR